MAETRHSDSGMTLIEILVVLALIGVTAGVVSYALPSPSRARSLQQEANLLAARLDLAAERSLVSGVYYRMEWQGNGYGFHEWQDDAWQTAQDAPLSEPHVLERGAVLTNADGAQRGVLDISPDLLPPTSGLARLRLASGAEMRVLTFDGAAAHVQETQP